MTVDRGMSEIAFMVLSGLASICKNLAENQKTPIELRAEAAKLVEEFEAAAPHHGELNLEAGIWAIAYRVFGTLADGKSPMLYSRGRFL